MLKKLLLTLPAVLVISCIGAPEEEPGDGELGTSEEAATLCANGSTVNGIDVSSWQGNINWTSVKSAGKSFAWIRVNHGLGDIDAKFATNWSAAKAAGLIRGPYQYFLPNEDALAQANLLISKVGVLGPGDLPAAFDIEELSGQAPSTVISKMRTWLSAVQKGTGKVPIIYTNTSTWNQLGNPQGFAGFPLWVANWNVSCPSMPATFGDWRAWQHSSTGSVSGISGAVDLDRFNGSLALLKTFAGTGASCILGDGLYCGGSGVIGDPRTLYRCTGGNISIEKACANGCKPAPTGQPDQCAAGGCPLGDGRYCGGNLVGGNYNTLYQCTGGTMTAVQSCANGCKYMPPGSSDICN